MQTLFESRLFSHVASYPFVVRGSSNCLRLDVLLIIMLHLHCPALNYAVLKSDRLNSKSQLYLEAV